MRSSFAPAASFATAAVLAVVCVLVGATGAQAVPTTVPLQATFDGLLPGSSASKSWQFAIPHDAQVTRAVLRKQGPGRAVWHAELCPSAGAPCVDLMTASVGTPVRAGDYALTVGVVVTALEPGSTQSIEGRFTFAQTDGELAQTGAQVLATALGSVAAAGAGGILVLLARRRQRTETHDAQA
jgi:hypothetical protein